MFWIAALAVAGCSGEDEEQEPLSRSEYQEAIFDVVKDSTAPTKLYTDLVVRPRPEDECERMMVRFHHQVNDLVDRVAALEPPPEGARIQDDFVRAAGRSVDRVEAIGERVAAGRVSCGRQLNDLLYGMPSSARAERAMAELEQRGYFVRGN